MEAFFNHKGHVLQEELHFIGLDALISVSVEAIERDHHLLPLVAHQSLEEESYKLVMIDPFVSIGVDLANKRFSQEFGQIQILLGLRGAKISLCAPAHQTKEDRAQVGHQYFLDEVSIPALLEMVDLERVNPPLQKVLPAHLVLFPQRRLLQ